MYDISLTFLESVLLLAMKFFSYAELVIAMTKNIKFTNFLNW